MTLPANVASISDRSALDLSLVIPVYNECESLKLLHEGIVELLARLPLQWEAIYVDDGSTDGSTLVLQELQQSDSRVVVAVQRRNFGKSLALAAGFALARGNILITLDADLQDDPAEIPNLLAKINDGYDVVLGWRHKRQDPLSKTIPSWIANRTTQLMTGLHIHDMNIGLKAYRAECIQQIQVYGDLHRYLPILAHFAGFRVAEIPVAHYKRRFGKSKYSTGRLLRGGLDLVTILFLNQYGRRPLHLFGLLGGVLLLIGFLINLGLSIEWLQGVRPIGNRPALILGVLLMLVGFQILTLGLLAELLVAFIQKNDNPLNTVRKVYQAAPQETPS